MGSLKFVAYFMLISITKVQQSHQQQTLELLQRLQNRIDLVEQTNRNYNNDIIRLNNRIQAQEQKENNDFNVANGRIANLQGLVNNLNNQVSANTNDIATANGRITALENNLLPRVTRLEDVNKIWRGNFQIVNRTFTEFRKKFKFAVPVIRIPVNGFIG